MRSVPATVHALVLALLPFAAPGAHAQGIQRCEDPSGRATYTNANCPAGTKPAREVNTAPPVSDADRRAAEARARQDSNALKAIEREQSKEAASAKTKADKSSKADADRAARCDKARRDLERARTTRTELSSRAATVEQMQRADREVGRREEDLGRACGKP